MKTNKMKVAVIGALALVAMASGLLPTWKMTRVAAQEANECQYPKFELTVHRGPSAQDQARDESLAVAPSDQYAELAPADGPEGRIEGTWRVTQVFGPPINDRNSALFTFGAGRDTNEGPVVHSDTFYFIPTPSCIGSQGVWRRTGERSFIGTHEAFCFDSTKNFDPGGNIKFRYAVTLNDTGTNLTGRARIELLDVAGKLLFFSDFTLNGVRMQAEAPPNP